METLKANIEANLFQKASTAVNSGLLRKKLDEYLGCFKIDYTKFQRLLDEDEAEWDKNEQNVKDSAAKFQCKIK